MTNEPIPSGRPTLKTIAYMTGLAVTTVSRALKDGPEIGEATRARVQLIARQIGYRPNRAGVRLRTGKTNVITVVLNAQDQAGGFFANFVFGVSDALIGSPYHLVITPYSLSDPMEPIRYIVETASADGVIISRTEPNDPRVRYLTDHGIPFATHGRTETGIAHPFHDFDNDAFAYEALRILKSKGRTRIALLVPPPALLYHRHTLIGFERGLRDFQLLGSPLASIDVDTPLDTIRATGREIAQRGERPDGIVCSAVSCSMAMAAGFADAGLTIGRDFDIVSKPSTPLLKIARPEIIAIPEDFHEAGFDLARMVMALIDGADPASLRRVVGPYTEDR